MSIYLPKIENYPLFDLDQLDTTKPSAKKKRKQPLFPLIPPIDETPESSVVPLPDIRVTNRHAQPSNDLQTTDDNLRVLDKESAGKGKPVVLDKDTVPAALKDAAVEDKARDVAAMSPREKKVFLGKKKSVWQNSLHKLRRLDSFGQAAVLVPEKHLSSAEEIRKKFSRAIKAVISIRKLAAIMIKKSEEPSALLQMFTDVIDSADNFSENLRNKGLSFDPSYFKANREISISNEVKNILNLPPSARTQDQIQTAMYGLQSLPSFAEYPLHMQEKLTKVAWYEKVSPRRTIIRQGHYAENFYFILSGQAVVTLNIIDPVTHEPLPRTANFMRKGTSFGELALLHRSRRTATVTSHDTVQLLSIGREDFFDIFMARQQSDEVPEHIKFISQLDFMKGWPIHRLLEHPEHCLLHFFKRNMVIVNDRNKTEWLYIVKSGSCQVLKQLRGVTAKLGIRKHETTLDERFHLPHTGTSVRGPKIDTGLLRPRLKSHASLADSTDDSEEGRATSGGTGISGERRRRRSGKTPPPPSLRQSSAPNGTAIPPPSSSPTSSLSRGVKGANASKSFSKESYSDMPATAKAHFRAPKHGSPSRVTGPRFQQRPPSLSPESTPRSGPPGSSAPPPPVFVQVSRLKPRDVFGLEFVRFHDDPNSSQTTVSLVSRGAECIMLSKDFFCKHANEMVKKNLQEQVRPYPDEFTFQESLQRKADWDLFKHTLIQDVTSLPLT